MRQGRVSIGSDNGLRKCVWKCLRNGGHFVLGEMSWLNGIWDHFFVFHDPTIFSHSHKVLPVICVNCSWSMSSQILNRSIISGKMLFPSMQNRTIMTIVHAIVTPYNNRFAIISVEFNPLKPKQSGRHVADGILNCFPLKEKISFSINMNDGPD